MLTHCDFVYAGESTKFRIPFIDLALPPNRTTTVRLRQTGAAHTFYWSVHELELWERK